MPQPSYSELKQRVVALENELSELKDVESQFNALFENSPIGVAYHRMVYDKNGEPVDFYYISANSRFKEYTGQDPTGRLVTEVFPGIEHDENFDWIGTCGKVARTGEPIRFQQHLPPVDRWYDIMVFQDKPDHFVVSFLEITEQKQAEIAMHQSQKLDAIGQLAGGVAHDFNNMLGGIIGAAELLNHYLPEESTPKKYHRIILESATRAANLTEQLLTFSRHYDPASTVINLHEIIEDVVLLLINTIDKRIDIHQNLTAASSTVIGDPALLQNIFLNLGINSTQAMPEGGTLSIQSQVTLLDTVYCETSSFDLQPGSFVEVEIRDTGCGISSDHLDKIFEPFFTTKEQGEGTGLGLSSTYGSIVKHKGAITVYSEIGHGTIFRVYLPLVVVDVATQTRLKKPISGTGKILVVDDEEVMRLTAKAILERLGYEIILAENGQEALQLFQEDAASYSLVLLDMVMPVMSGRDCFFALKKLDPKIPVLLSSGFSHEEDLAALKANGLDGFIKKPYLSNSLSHAVSKIKR